jgi:ATP synthase protein I
LALTGVSEFVNLADSPLPSSPIDPDSSQNPESASPPSLEDYYALQQEIFLITLGMTGVIFGSTWWFYNLKTALSYLLGACTGIVYLRMLARSVERLGSQGKPSGGPTRLALIAGIVILAAQWEQLQFLPVFLGFLTYKAALIVYTLRVSLLP